MGVYGYYPEQLYGKIMKEREGNASSSESKKIYKIGMRAV